MRKKRKYVCPDCKAPREAETTSCWICGRDGPAKSFKEAEQDDSDYQLLLGRMFELGFILLIPLAFVLTIAATVVEIWFGVVLAIAFGGYAFFHLARLPERWTTDDSILTLLNVVGAIGAFVLIGASFLWALVLICDATGASRHGM